MFANPPASVKGVQSNSVLSSKFLPASGTNAAFNFTERRHVAVIRALPGAKPDAVTSFATLAAIRRASSWWAAPHVEGTECFLKAMVDRAKELEKLLR
jgi:hypothetical protein